MSLKVSPHYGASQNLLWEIELWTGSLHSPVGTENMFHIVCRSLFLH